ncbi:hypothetical protein DEO72_LG2g3525 [Vigna unguiculata]|uniref:Uncharacterized protein n=1 Tax=Vigna unguiculata TaxID=3917 RepID=A0A4D6L3U5_VIGUN|nr:hypothetical protein DEO72_LG2g3525 [Vigna unguiculata]
MHLPAHGTASPDPSKASLSVKTTHQEGENNSVSAWPGPHSARRNCSRAPGGIHSASGASALPDPVSYTPLAVYKRQRLSEKSSPKRDFSVRQWSTLAQSGKLSLSEICLLAQAKASSPSEYRAVCVRCLYALMQMWSRRCCAMSG